LLLSTSWHLYLSLALMLTAEVDAETASRFYNFRLPGLPYTSSFDDDDDDDSNKAISQRSELKLSGAGREFILFDARKDKANDDDANDPACDITTAAPHLNVAERVRAGGDSFSSYPYRSYGNRRTGGGPSSKYYYSFKRQRSNFFRPVSDWWLNNVAPNIKSWPKIQCRVEPTTTLKLRKTFRPLGTIVRLGADYNTQLGVWQFKSSWEDAIIGGKLTLAGRELQLTKSWQLSVGAVEDLVTRLRLRAAVDLSTWKAYVRVGFRTERLSPINVMEGFTLQKEVPLDGPAGHVKLQVKANFALPEPEIEYSTETQRSLIGMGDIHVNIEELNLLLDY